jgi:hypothetical protein
MFKPTCFQTDVQFCILTFYFKGASDVCGHTGGNKKQETKNSGRSSIWKRRTIIITLVKNSKHKNCEFIDMIEFLDR